MSQLLREKLTLIVSASRSTFTCSYSYKDSSLRLLSAPREYLTFGESILSLGYWTGDMFVRLAAAGQLVGLTWEWKFQLDFSN